MRSKKVAFNAIIGLVYEITNMICSFIMPRLILSQLGSDYNGLTSAIMQFLNGIIILKAGIAGVTRAALYKPLSNNDTKKVSEIINATQYFMKKVTLIFSIGLIVFALIYPIFVQDEFDWLFVSSLILIMGLGTLIQNYFGSTYHMLISADQKNYVYSTIQTITLLINTIISVILITNIQSIHVLKIASLVIYILNPILLNLYVYKNYKIDKTVKPDFSVISQRWDAFTQEIAVFINNNTDIVILTIFSSVWEISVYTVYYMVLGGVRAIIMTLCSGFCGALGNMLAKNERNELLRNTRIYEFIIFTISTISFTCTMILIVPFVMLYTKGITDVNYMRPLFGNIATICYFFYCIRLPYYNLVEVAGHFKQTRNGAIFESVMNITISIICVRKFGLIGVTFGTLCAMIFRTFQYAIHSSKYILNRSLNIFIKRLTISVLEIVTILFIIGLLPNFVISNYMLWILRGAQVFCISSLVVIGYSGIFFKDELIMVIKKFKSVIHK